jgi:phytoene synthase
MHNRTEEKEIINHARKITKHFGTSYYFATWFFPKTIREYAWIMYSFYRHPDELVDNSSEDREEQELNVWMKEWESAKKKGKSTNMVIQGALITHTNYAIPFSYSDTFLEAMKMDLSIKRYDTYESLKEYMYGSASVVGITMTHIMNGDKRTFPYAEKLGYAMQLTNFIRDIHEDYEKRDRIYIPQNEMEAYGITEVDIQNRVYNQYFKELPMLNTYYLF